VSSQGSWLCAIFPSCYALTQTHPALDARGRESIRSKSASSTFTYRLIEVGAHVKRSSLGPRGRAPTPVSGNVQSDARPVQIVGHALAVTPSQLRGGSQVRRLLLSLATGRRSRPMPAANASAAHGCGKAAPALDRETIAGVQAQAHCTSVRERGRESGGIQELDGRRQRAAKEEPWRPARQASRQWPSR
jgi:hypothetical protein